MKIKKLETLYMLITIMHHYTQHMKNQCDNFLNYFNLFLGGLKFHLAKIACFNT